jgi:hypothetical protein
MGADRDFSADARRKLKELIIAQETDLSGWWKVFETDLRDLSLREEKDHVQSIDRYHRKIVKMRENAAAHLDRIWTNVYRVEREGLATAQQDVEELLHIGTRFRTLASIIEPTGAGTAPPPVFQQTKGLFRKSVKAALGDGAARIIERENDLLLQAAVNEYLSGPSFQEALWEHLKVSEKSSLLQRMVRDLNRILGIRVQRRIRFEMLGPYHDGLSEVANYDSKTKQITVDTAFLYSRKNSHILLRALVHEMRHAYQHEAVEMPGRYLLSDETRKQWMSDFDHPWAANNTDYATIAAHAVEYDACCFAGQPCYVEGITPRYAGSWGA